MGWAGLIFLILAGLSLVLLGDRGSMGGLDGDDLAALSAGIALLIFIGIPALRSYKGQLSQGLKDSVVWLGFALVLVIGYSFRGDLKNVWQRLAGELMPPGSAINVATDGATARAVRIRRRPDGHFAVHGKVNGTNLTLLVDTGASSVVLSNRDARAIGLDVGKLRYSVPVQTANGTSYAAPVLLRTISVGNIAVAKVPALVSKPGALNESLLGMSFLTRLRSYTVTGEFLTLRS